MKSGVTKSLIPKLRFPEFREAGEWKFEPLGDLTSLVTERVGNKKCTPMSITAGVGLVSQLEKFGRVIAGNQLKNYLLLQENDFAYNKSATKDFPQGFIALYTNTEVAAVPNSIFTCFRVRENKVNNTFLNYLFMNNLHGRWLQKYITVGARAHGSLNINDKDLLSLPVPVPTGKTASLEQQKIGDCLTSLDELIAVHTEKLELLKEHKKGLMQQLFPLPDETTPRLRFPEFKNSGEWCYKPLDSVGEIVTGKTPSTKDSSLWNGDILFITPTDIVNDEKYIYKTDRNVIKTDNMKVLPAGSIIFTCIASIGKMAITTCPSITNQQINTIVANYNIDREYIFYALANLTPWIQSIPASSTLPIINKTEFSKICIPVPFNIVEQQRIACFFTSLDDQITAQAEKLEALKIYKKGLLQQLFAFFT